MRKIYIYKYNVRCFLRRHRRKPLTVFKSTSCHKPVGDDIDRIDVNHRWVTDFETETPFIEQPILSKELQKFLSSLCNLCFALTVQSMLSGQRRPASLRTDMSFKPCCSSLSARNTCYYKPLMAINSPCLYVRINAKSVFTNTCTYLQKWYFPNLSVTCDCKPVKYPFYIVSLPCFHPEQNVFPVCYVIIKNMNKIML